MEEGTTITVRGNEIKIPKGYVIIFRGDFRHAGSAYKKKLSFTYIIGFVQD